MIRLVQEVLFQQERTPLPLTDLSLREGIMLTLLAGVNIYVGVHPAPLLELIRVPVTLLVGTP
jgi:NADH-quinone oxidoreductase subunit M